MSESKISWQWQLDWKSVLAMVLALPILLSLGNWQLNRAAEKRELLAEAETRRLQPAVNLLSLRSYPNYQPIWVEGEFDSRRYWLLDNRIFQGRFGYEIIALLKLSGGGELLVNRGWVAGSHDRAVLPKVEFPAGKVKLSGELYRGVGKNFSVDQQLSEMAWPRRQQWLELDSLQDEFPHLLPTVLRLDADQPLAFQIQPVGVNISPEKHIGYAVQWFGMAGVFGVFFILRNSNIGQLWRNRKCVGT